MPALIVCPTIYNNNDKTMSEDDENVFNVQSLIKFVMNNADLGGEQPFLH